MNRENFVFSILQLKNYLVSRNIDITQTQFVENTFSLLMPKYYVDLINWGNKNDPLRKMVLTDSLEQNIKGYEIHDPIGDYTHSPVPGIIHRYPDRCLLMLTNICAVHCRFCFRKNLLSKNKADFIKSIEYVKDHKELWEVILSGGDPFMLTNHFLSNIINNLNHINHVKVLRFHTRTPAVYPHQITDTFTQILSTIKKQLIIVIHINHPREITKEFIHCVIRLKKTGAMLLSQTVLMKDINNNSQILAQLFKKLVEVGIKPYYLHHLDIAAGTHYFRVSIQEGKQIMQELRGNISGVCMPEYILDTPGGYGKIPISWFRHTDQNTYIATSFEGKQVIYTDPIND